MTYWMPKFKNLSPWALPEKIPTSNLEVAKLAVQRMGSVDPATEMEIFQTSELRDAIDDIWIVSGQSATQRGLLNSVSYTFLYLKQGNCIRCQSVAFMDIRTRKPYSKDIIIEPSVHEQEDG